MPPPDYHQNHNNVRPPSHFGQHHSGLNLVQTDWKSHSGIKRSSKNLLPKRLLSPTAFADEGTLLKSPRPIHNQSSMKPMRSHFKNKQPGMSSRVVYRDDNNS